MMKFLTATIWALCLLELVTAAPVRSGAVEAELISEADDVTAGQSIDVALRIKTASHWHVYWKNPGDSGTAVKAKWELPDALEAGKLLFPVPQIYETAGFVTFGHEGEILLLTKLHLGKNVAVGTTLPIKVTVSWLACDPSRCVPGRAELKLMLKVTGGSPKPNRWTKTIKDAREALPRPTKGQASVNEKTVTLKVPAAAVPTAATKGTFFPTEPGMFKLSDPEPRVTKDARGGVTIVLQRNEDTELPPTISGVLAFPDSRALQVEATP